MIAIKTTTSPTLSSGAFTVTFGQFEKINSASVSFDDPFTASYAFAASRSISGNVVTVTVKKQNLGSPGAWANAVTSDLNGKTVTIVAEGEV